MTKNLAAAEVVSLKQVVDTCACANLRRTTRVVTRHFDEAFRSLGLRSTQLVILMHVAQEEKGAYLSNLSRALAMDASTLTRNLTPLERAGYIMAEKTPAGRRRSVHLTEKGVEVLREAMPLWQSAQDEVAGKISDAGWEHMRAGLQRLAS